MDWRHCTGRRAGDGRGPGAPAGRTVARAPVTPRRSAGNACVRTAAARQSRWPTRRSVRRAARRRAVDPSPLRLWWGGSHERHAQGPFGPHSSCSHAGGDLRLAPAELRRVSAGRRHAAPGGSRRSCAPCRGDRRGDSGRPGRTLGRGRRRAGRAARPHRHGRPSARLSRPQGRRAPGPDGDGPRRHRGRSQLAAARRGPLPAWRHVRRLRERATEASSAGGRATRESSAGACSVSAGRWRRWSAVWRP